MTDATGVRRDLLESIADEFLHNARSGRRLLAVEGADDALATRFAADLADVIRDRGRHVLHRPVGDVSEQELRAGTVEPFRSGDLPGAEDPDTILVVDGRRLLNEAVIGIWHFSVWTLVGDELPHSGANVIVDATDESAPTRFFYDYCRIPPSIGERRAAG
ncbi:hypothetical protein GCM10009819_17430 [Agromyces tropicus]|uniref:Uridine kinase n=1 Tax=Agromyces tropicus TaxID=555371 RepID=A0ABP5FTR3_9MICO